MCLRIPAIVVVRSVLAPVRDWRDHIVGFDHTVDFWVNSFLTNISSGVGSNEISIMGFGIPTVVVVGSIFSPVWNRRNHVVSLDHSVDLGVDTLLSDVSSWVRGLSKANSISVS